MIRTSAPVRAASLLHAPCALPRAHTPQALAAANRQLCDALAAIDPRHESHHRADRIEGLLETHRPALQAQRHSLQTVDRGLPPQEAEQRRFNLAVGRALATVLLHGPRLLRLFPGGQEGLWPVPVEGVLRRLCRESADVFAHLRADPTMRDSALAHAALLEPDAQAPLGLVTTCAQERRAIERLRDGAGGPALDLTSALQLRDYAHACTGSFNFYRAADLLAQWLPQEEAWAHFEGLLQRIRHSVEAMWRHPAARVERELRKGWALGGVEASAPLAPGTQLRIRGPFSATSQPCQTYTARDAQYDAELILRGGPGGPVQGVDIAAFHRLDTAHECEVLLREHQVLRIVGEAWTERPGRHSRMWVAVFTAEVERGADGAARG